MHFFILVISLSFFINCFYLIYDEIFLLGLYFFLFFFLVYVFFKNKFKILNIFKILKKYILFITLFKVNFNCNNLLKFFLIISKSLFSKFIAKLIYFKNILNSISDGILNKHKILINLLFLFFLCNGSYIIQSLILHFFFLFDKVILNDINLCY